MDLLFSKYASPFILLDGLILTGSLSPFIDDFIGFVTDKIQWELFLHKVFDKTWSEFKSEVKPSTTDEEIDLGATIIKSKDMLNNFTPE